MKGCCRSSSWVDVLGIVERAPLASMKGCCRSSSWWNSAAFTAISARLNEGLLPKQQLVVDGHAHVVGDVLASMKGCCRRSSWPGNPRIHPRHAGASMKGCCRSSSWAYEVNVRIMLNCGLNEGLLPKQQLGSFAARLISRTKPQ